MSPKFERFEMVILTATYRNGVLELKQPLPAEFEGKEIQIQVEELEAVPKKRRQAGSAAGQIWTSPDFDEPLDDFKAYMS
jgi:predicted DNA-binding antitoxin AbrB/MazE fold protein